MLKLPPDQGIFGEEVVTIHPVVDATGAPWQPDSAAEVLLLGDSFANIYSLELMNWGAAAGLAEQLSFALRRPVDTILRNDDGAFATRETLSRELAQGDDRLAGKKVVVWQFAARELAVGDWKMLDMTLRQPSQITVGTAPAGGELIVSGTVAAKSAAPRAGQMPYAHHIFTLDLTDLQVHSGTLTESKIAVYLFSMRNQQNTPAFSWPVGTRVKLRLQPWRPDYFRKYGRINRTETNDIQLKHPWWGEVIQ
jgi:alginate O-acetyltransferase complex protein AlgJ